MERFGSIGNFVSIEQCRSIFPWLVPLISDWSVRHNGKHPGTRRPGTPASMPWSLETTRCGHKINMAAMEVEEDNTGVVVKVEIGIQR